MIVDIGSKAICNTEQTEMARCFQNRSQNKLKLALIRRNIEFMKKTTNKKMYSHDCISENGINCLESIITASKPKLLIKVQQCPHGKYSMYVPLKCKNYHASNQISSCLPYLTHLEENEEQQAIYVWHQILSNLLHKHDNKQRTPQELWSLIHSKYNPKISISQKIQKYQDVLKYGTQTLSENQSRDKNSLFHMIRMTGEYMNQSGMIDDHISITALKHEKITFQSIEKTMKSLYCTLCYQYDCEHHQIHNQGLLNIPYIDMKQKITQGQHFFKGIELLNQYIQTKPNQSPFCSQECYQQYVNEEQTTKKEHLERRWLIQAGKLSLLSKGLIDLGIQIFSYSPCNIHKLFKDQKVSCGVVFIYLVKQRQLTKLLNSKMHKDEIQMLLSETQDDQEIKLEMKHQRKRKNKHKSQNQTSSSSSISICIHHFIGSPSKDISCKACVCQMRGYCLPQCLCTEKCPIMKIGCKCKSNGQAQSCKSKRCPCFKNNIECIPEICSNCCSNPTNLCLNSSISYRKWKNLKVGKSLIPNAGLGLFAGEDIRKDELVTVYLGEKVEPYIEELREKFKKDNSFFNFETQQYNIDAKFIGNKARFINHGDNGQQNLQVKKKFVNGEEHIVFFALRNIKHHEELLFNYDGSGQLVEYHREKYPFIKPKK